MKMRRTIYPLALLIAIPLVLIVFYILNQGKFEIINMEHQSIELADVESTGYMKIDLEWNGFGDPVLQSFNAQRTPDEDVPALVVQPLVGVPLEEAVEQLIAGEKLPLVTDYKLTEKTMTLLLETKQGDRAQVKEGNKFLLRYRTFGIIREQEMTWTTEDDS